MVNDIGLLFQILVAAAATAVPIVVLVRLIAGREADRVAGGFQSPTDPSWPRGVQEEDPIPWKVSPAASAS